MVVCDEGRDARAACCGRHLPLQRHRERAVQLNTLLIYNQQQDELNHQCRCGLKTKTIHVRGKKGIEIGARNNEACEGARSRRLEPDLRMVVTAQRLDRTQCNHAIQTTSKFVHARANTRYTRRAPARGTHSVRQMVSAPWAVGSVQKRNVSEDSIRAGAGAGAGGYL